jgi:hypothetical protein
VVSDAEALLAGWSLLVLVVIGIVATIRRR